MTQEFYDRYVIYGEDSLDRMFELMFPKNRRDDKELFNLGVEAIKRNLEND